MKNCSGYISLLLGFILFACSGSEKTYTDDEKGTEKQEIFIQEVDLFIIDLNLWINLMPGSDTRLHISGEIEIRNDYNYDFEFMELYSISLLQNDEVIHIIKPTVQIDTDLSDEKNKYLRFSTIRGILPDVRLNLEESCNLVMLFEDGNENFEFIIENKKIEKTY